MKSLSVVDERYQQGDPFLEGEGGEETDGIDEDGRQVTVLREEEGRHDREELWKQYRYEESANIDISPTQTYRISTIQIFTVESVLV